MRLSRGFVLVAMLCAVAVLSGCAAIPSSSSPTVVRGLDDQQRTRPMAPPPEPGIDKLSLVRDFIRYSGNPTDNNAAARQYLAQQQRQDWRPGGSLVVLADNFNTTPVAEDDDPNRASLELRGTQIGRLNSDRSFSPAAGGYDMKIKVIREGGEWRISEPPPDLVVTNSAFTQSYESVPVYFLSPDRSRVVPDLRYIVTEPRSSEPGQIVDLLLKGPSTALGAAVNSQLPDGARTRTNVAPSPEGQLVVDLSHLGNPSPAERQLIAAQIVLSLSSVTVSRVRLLSDGVILAPEHPDWTLDDVQTFQSDMAARQDLPGLVVSNGVLRSFDTGTEVKGAAGPGSPAVISGAESVDGARLATVVRIGESMSLRIGPSGEPTRDAGLVASKLTRPSWKPNAHELWTVANSSEVHRLVDDGDGSWVDRTAATGSLASDGPITDLRLSRDGARVAVVAGQRLFVAAVVTGSDGSVNIVQPQEIMAGTLTNVVAVDWDRQDSLTVATLNNVNPVYRVSVDGLSFSPFSSANLTQPLTAITAAPNKPVVVADHTGLWIANDAKEIWHLHPRGQGVDLGTPFYPG